MASCGGRRWGLFAPKPRIRVHWALDRVSKRVFDTLRMKAESGFRFHSMHQFLVKWRFQALTGSEPLILRPGIDSGSGFQPLLGDVHIAACGLKSKGLRALRCIPRVLDSLEVGVRHCSWAAGEAGLRRAKRAGKRQKGRRESSLSHCPFCLFPCPGACKLS